MTNFLNLIVVFGIILFTILAVYFFVSFIFVFLWGVSEKVAEMIEEERIAEDCFQKKRKAKKKVNKKKRRKKIKKISKKSKRKNRK